MAGLLFFLTALQLFGARPVESVDPGAEVVCLLAREISSMGPCLGPENCPSLDTFRRHFGVPGPRWLQPEPGRGPWEGARRWILPGPWGGSSGPLICPAEDSS